MSQQSAEIIAAYESYLVNVIITYSMTMVYEYLITLNDEITMIWRRTWTVVTWLFMTNRYLMIVSTIWAAVPATAKVRLANY
ncbi:hypothetical protein EW026_g4752 [Hermanssonia centrifuga]|uniref:DUF6533 domain-containing protein n=1 Tax=Hermanssonia centrifuga TaxID=98765 RepID=A0A4S4KKN5_9APHY|nr:hypothetical protein EW026_g4752 [Hermanssonia centrifuga]